VYACGIAFEKDRIGQTANTLSEIIVAVSTSERFVRHPHRCVRLARHGGQILPTVIARTQYVVKVSTLVGAQRHDGMVYFVVRCCGMVPYHSTSFLGDQLDGNLCILDQQNTELKLCDSFGPLPAV
jgi:hypothetical protein